MKYLVYISGAVASLLLVSTLLAGGSYKDYSEAAYNASSGEKRVLFFHAKWCPACKGADKEFKSSASSLADGVVVFKVDYDKEKELKKKYGITSQHTFVLVDSSGKLVKKWSGGNIAKVNQQVE